MKTIATILVLCSMSFASAHVVSHAAKEAVSMSPAHAAKRVVQGAKLASFPVRHPKKSAKAVF